MTIKKILLQNSSEGMILARDVVDHKGRILITSGIALKRELVKLLEKHDITSIFVQEESIPAPPDVELIQDILRAETRLKLITSVKDTFGEPDGIAAHLGELQSQVEDIVHTMTSRKNLCIYMADIDHVSNYLFMHSVNVGLFSIIIGMAMNLPYQELCLLGMGGILHDFGKTKIPSHIIDKQGQLTIAEFNEIKQHSALGYNLLKADTNLDHRIMFIALQHHERRNGSGYPWGIAKDKIHPLARIVAVADVYDALTTDRVYRSRLSSHAAIKIINEGNYTHFDPDVISAFNKIALPYTIGSTVQLNTGTEGSVIRLNSADLFRPLIITPNGIINLLTEPDLNIIAAI